MQKCHQVCRLCGALDVVGYPGAHFGETTKDVAAITNKPNLTQSVARDTIDKTNTPKVDFKDVVTFSRGDA